MPSERSENLRDRTFSPRVPEALRVVDANQFEGQLSSISLQGATITRSAGPLLIDGARITATDLSESRFVRPSVGDAIFDDCNLANAHWSESALTRVAFRECQMTGFDANASALIDVHFWRCKLSLSSFRFLVSAKVQFTDCEMDGTDFHGVDLRRCRFDRCILTGSLFHGANADCLDLRSSALAAVQGIDGLRGALIDQLQLLELAESLAAHAGLLVRERHQ
ncbi:MAG: pentapeptide repeat-containing protein [Candidatus Dormiibacterota bacterium]